MQYKNWQICNSLMKEILTESYLGDLKFIFQDLKYFCIKLVMKHF